MSSTKFYFQWILGLVLIGSGAQAIEHPVQIKQSSLKQVLINCKPPSAKAGTPSTVLVYEDVINGVSKWMLVTKIGKTQVQETKALSVNPKRAFSNADAWTGASRFMKSFDLKTKHSDLQISSHYDEKRAAYGAYYDGRRFFCTLEKPIPETFAVIQNKLRHEKSYLQASNKRHPSIAN